MTWTHFINRTQGRPDNVSPATVSTAVGTHLDIAHLDTQGLLSVPTPKTDPAQNAFVQPIISQYGYVQNGVAVGGGLNGVGTTFDKDDFFRDGIQFGYNYTWLMSSATHTCRGYCGIRHGRAYAPLERLGLDRCRRAHEVPVTVGTPIFYQATFQQQTPRHGAASTRGGSARRPSNST
jgi:hypothetical protein